MLEKEVEEKLVRMARMKGGHVYPSDGGGAWAEPAAGRRTHHGVVHADVVFGAVPADKCEAMAAGAEEPDGYGPAYRDEGLD